MSNYFELVSNISKIKLGKAPTAFALLTNKKYIKIIDALNTAVQDFFLRIEHNFRDKKLSFNTVVNQQAYQHAYGLIEKLIIDKYEITYNSDCSEFILNTSTGKPSEYCIYDGKIYFNVIPDAVYKINVFYKTDRFIKQVNLTDAESTSGQNKVYLTSTTGIVAGDIIILEPDTVRTEVIEVLSVTINDYVTATTNLTFTHSTGSKVIKEKYALEYESDEPNFPQMHHKILEFHSLKQLYSADPAKLQKYSVLYEDKFKEIKVLSRGSSSNKPYFRLR